MAAKYAAIGMDFIDDDILEIFKQLDPLGVVGQDVSVQHIRIGDHDMPGLADGLARSTLRVTIIGISLDVNPERLNHFIQTAYLIGGQCLGGKQVQRAGVLVFQNGRDNVGVTTT